MQANSVAFSVSIDVHASRQRSGPVLIYSNPKPAHDAKWLDYLRSLPERGVSRLVAANAEQMWRRLRPLAIKIATPSAEVTEAGGLFMSWERNAHHLEIEMMPTGRYEWFYRNRLTDEFGGDYDYPAKVMTPELLAQFRLVAEND